MTKNRGSRLLNGNSHIPPEMLAEMDRVYAGALEVISRHKKAAPPGAPEPLPQAEASETAPRPAAPTVPGRGRRKIGSKTRFRRVEGRTRIMPRSLRAKALAYLAAKPQAAATLAELEEALPGAARGVVGKLIEAGWLEIVS